MLQQAIADDHRAKRMFATTLKAEAAYAKVYQMALEAVTQGKDLTAVELCLCPGCGNIEVGKAPNFCPICGAKGDKFVKV
jgi:rubrerythrin